MMMMMIVNHDDDDDDDDNDEDEDHVINKTACTPTRKLTLQVIQQMM